MVDGEGNIRMWNSDMAIIGKELEDREYSRTSWITFWTTLTEDSLEWDGLERCLGKKQQQIYDLY